MLMLGPGSGDGTEVAVVFFAACFAEKIGDAIGIVVRDALPWFWQEVSDSNL